MINRQTVQVCDIHQLIVNMLLMMYIFVITTNIAHAQKSCDSFKNVSVELKNTKNVKFNQTVDGCIERIEFGNMTITEAYIRHQKVPSLGRDSVRNMKHLSVISFFGCELNEVLPYSFRNLPRLNKVQISYCNLKEIPRGVFTEIPGLELVRIHNNQIDFIENQAFANLTSLQRIYGSDNNLEYWNREWFDDSVALEIMDFQSNKIRTIPRRAFAALSKLRQIFFDYNEIATIQEDAFKGLKNLEYLGLRNNRLTELNENAFPNEISIRSLLINANYLNFIPNEVLRKISVKDFVIDYNPWKCPCLDRIYYWIHTINGTLRKSDQCDDSHLPVCVYAKVYSQTCLEYVDQQVTNKYIEMLRNLKGSLDKNCITFTLLKI